MLKPRSTYASDGFPTTDTVSKTVSRNATSVHVQIDKWFKINFSTVISYFNRSHGEWQLRNGIDFVPITLRFNNLRCLSKLGCIYHLNKLVQTHLQ